MLKKFLLSLLIPFSLSAAQQLRTMTRATSTTGANDSALTLLSDSASRTRALSIAQLRKSLSVKAFDSLVTSKLNLTGATITGTPTWSSNQAITLSTATQPNITSVGTLTSLTLSGALSGVTTLGLSGAITSTVTGTAFVAASSTTQAPLIFLSNTSGDLSVGVDNSVGNRWIGSGGTAYSASFVQSNAKPFQWITNGVLVSSLSSAGALTTASLIATAIPSEGSTQSALCITSGGVVQQNAASSCLVSSLRYKENISPLKYQEAHKIVTSLKSISYEEKENHRKEIGFGAEDLYKIDPRLVALDKDSLPQAVRYENIVPILTLEIQHQNEEIKQLKLIICSEYKHRKSHFCHS